MIDSLIITIRKIDREIKYRERDRTRQQHIAIYEALLRRELFEAFHHMFLHLDSVRQKLLK